MDSTIIMTIITLLITIVLPILGIIIIFRRDRTALKWAVVGALVFFIFQIATRIPALNYLSLQPWYIKNISSNTLMLAVFLAFTAGLFEEGGRYLAFRLVLEDRITWQRGLAFGIGHGGMEAIYLVGLPYVNQLVLYFSNGSSVLGTVPSNTILLAGAERLLAMIMHVGFTMIVLYGVKRKKFIYLLYAILAHGLVNAPTVLISNYIFIYIYLILWTTALLFVTLRLRKPLDKKWGFF